jgi:hypothetical protein
VRAVPRAAPMIEPQAAPPAWLTTALVIGPPV